MPESYRIMIVEDSETQALMLGHIFETEGWRVSCVPTAEAALTALNEQLPDLVVVDHFLPGIQGDELCRRIRMNVNTRALSILMLTGEEEKVGLLRGLHSGADDYLPKSTDTDVLLLRVRALLRKTGANPSILSSRDAPFRSARLLAVDDSLTYLEYLSGEMSREGYEVETATGGAQALEMLARRTYDGVLVDLVMPGIDGIEVCRRISQNWRTIDNPTTVLMLTAHETKEDMTRGLEAGADDFVGKSSDMAVIKARVQVLLRRKFFQEENRRILEELKNKELEAVRSRAETEAFQVRAALAGRLEEANRELEETNRKLREAQVHLIHSEKMASLGQLVAGIAHEINNPLSFVSSNVYTIDQNLERLASGIDPSARPMLDKIRSRIGDTREGLTRIRDLVTNLRTFSRLDEGEFKTVDIHECIDSVLLFLKHKIADRIVVRKDYRFSRRLSCYAGQLNQVVMNVIANAVESISGAGTVVITTGERDEDFLLSVKDTGAGIPQEIRHRIFEPFFTTKPVGEGMGLGLAISYGIVQSHRGSIDVTTEEGKGTEFTIRIPLKLA